jgi:O-antigen/teichoic acid export membrane protein
MQQLHVKVSKGIKWTTLSSLVPKIISPLIMIVLARLLAPEYFGLISTAMIVISFSQIFWEAGLTRALIQSNEPIELSGNLVFWSNLILSILLYLIIFFIAPLVSKYYHNEQTIIVLRVLGLQIIFMSLTSVQEAIFSKELNFKPLFAIKLICSVSNGIVSIILALTGYGVWALVYGTLSGVIINLILIWKKSYWRPTLSIQWKLASKFYRYGFWVLFLSLLGWLINWFDSILIGKYFGIRDLGIYRTGVTIISMIFSIFITPIATVMFPSFSKLNGDRIKIKKHFNEINKLIILIVLPIGVGLFMLSNEIVNVFFGQKWAGISVVIGLLGITEAIANFCSINPIVFQSIGRPDLQPKLSTFLIFLFIIVYWFVAPYGIIAMLVAKLILAIITTPINMYVMVRVLKLPPFYIIHQGKYIFISCILMSIFIIVLKFILKNVNLNSDLVILILSILFSAIFYFFLLFKLENEFMKKLIFSIKSSLY